MNIPISPSIILVEDDLRLSELVSRYLENNGFRVITIARGDQVVEQVRRDAPDLVILDLGLPGQDGFSICRQLRPLYTNPILILTARDNDIFATLVPAIAEYVQRDARPDIRMCAQVRGDSDSVVCDVHLLEAVLKNLLYNSSRYAKSEVRVAFSAHDGVNQLLVDDDGPGIPEKDRQRVFESFVQLDDAGGKKAGFGLGLAIVKRAIEWHGGGVSISQSPLGGARFCATWPAIACPPSVQ